MRESEDIAKSASAADRVERRLKEIERGMNAERNHATKLASNVATDLLRRSQSKWAAFEFRILSVTPL